MKKTFMSLAVTALLGLSGVAASAAPVYPDFTINETSVPGVVATGTNNTNYTADKMNGAYSEYITIDASLNFSSSAYVDFGAFFANDGTTIVKKNELNHTYGLYGVFSSTGYADPLQGKFFGTGGSVSLWIDPNGDTDKTIASNGTVTKTNDSDDYEIAFSFDLTGVGSSGTPNAFDFLFSNFQLTALGSQYFTSPSSPFYQFAIVNGDFDNIPIGPGTTFVTGDLSAVFSKIPEPGSLALLGLGLAGLGFTQRRRNLSK